MMIKAILLVAFPLVLIFGIDWKTVRTGIFRTDVMRYEDTENLRGIAALFVIFAHYTLKMKHMGYSLGSCKPFTWLGGMGVCIFFFLSGYGMSCSAKKNGMTLKKLIRRILTIYLPILAVRAVFMLIEQAALEKPEGSGILYFLGLKNGPWYLNELIIMCVLFFIAYRVGKENRGIWLGALTGGLIIMSICFGVLGFPARWYDSNIMFALGTAVALYKKEILEFLEKHYYGKMIFVAVCFLLSTVVYTTVKGEWIAVVLKIISGTALNMLALMVIMRVPLRSKILQYCGKRSLYLYLTHISLWVICVEHMKNIQAVFAVSLVLTFILSELFYIADRAITKK